ncbi:unnamed protein product [Vitrella brassicaformis CCMP3155]|uniref:Uncharacterized protein n=1 Tax=Vitrella brassicaformis (strain CCMP3155) TaxID=1169540 RepID=A0A0G4GPG7_VITBC|nr:unnamed protein product [Vitrella brassicaformis CCMP3155]|eukprot:CEM32073.1 unnamed protein product [Vitrella brassicaformis CCMP3155]
MWIVHEPAALLRETPSTISHSCTAWSHPPLTIMGSVGWRRMENTPLEWPGYILDPVPVRAGASSKHCYIRACISRVLPLNFASERDIDVLATRKGEKVLELSVKAGTGMAYRASKYP